MKIHHECKTCNEELYEVDEKGCIDKSMRSKQSLSVGSQLTSLIQTYADDVRKYF